MKRETYNRSIDFVLAAILFIAFCLFILYMNSNVFSNYLQDCGDYYYLNNTESIDQDPVCGDFGSYHLALLGTIFFSGVILVMIITLVSPENKSLDKVENG